MPTFSPAIRRKRLLTAAERLCAYSERVKGGLQSPEVRDHQAALADVAEAHEISRRLYSALEKFLRNYHC
jgi:hypothetical protein